MTACESLNSLKSIIVNFKASKGDIIRPFCNVWLEFRTIDTHAVRIGLR